MATAEWYLFCRSKIIKCSFEYNPGRQKMQPSDGAYEWRLRGYDGGARTFIRVRDGQAVGGDR
jgi:hypothetical protein